MELMECYYKDRSQQERLHAKHIEIWMSRIPTSTLIKKHVEGECYNINKGNIISTLEIQRLQQSGNNTEQCGCLVETRSLHNQ